jgi:tetratricopeptide (TPR) repeat protein
VARRGVRALRGGEEQTSATDAWRDAVARSRDDAGAWEPDEVWVQDEDEQPAGGKAARRSSEGAGHRRNVPAPVVDELAAAAGAQRGSKLAARLADATHAYERERYQEARRILRPLAEEVPDAAAVQELFGLVLYRSGQWALAARHLEVYRSLTGSTDQHPVLADCYRALRRYDTAEELWDELREASPGGDLVAEGRIVAAGCRADQGDLPGAIALLERTAKRVHRPQERHLRQWYTLADLYERAGDLPRARDLFGRVDASDPDAFDVRQRLRALR